MLQLGIPHRVKKFGEMSFWKFTEGSVGWGKYGDTPIIRQGFGEVCIIECGGCGKKLRK